MYFVAKYDHIFEEICQVFFGKTEKSEKFNIKCEGKRKPPDALFFYLKTAKRPRNGHFIKSVFIGVG